MVRGQRREFCQYHWMLRNQFPKARWVYGWAVRKMMRIVPGMSGPLELCRLEPCKNLRSRRRLSRFVPHSRARDAREENARFRSVGRPAGCSSSAYRPALLELP